MKSILKDETYIGNTIHYRETNISYKNKHRVRKDPSEWLRICGTHEPIISEAVFRQVQDMIAKRRRQQKDATTQIFSGLLKCAACGYSIKVNRDKDKYYLVCSGRSNLGLCGASIRVGLRELESAVEAELEKLLAECPDVEEPVTEDQETARALAQIDQKIERLISALAESSDLTMPYINRTIEKLEGQRSELLKQQTRLHKIPRQKLCRLKFGPLDFAQRSWWRPSLSGRSSCPKKPRRLSGRYEAAGVVLPPPLAC